MPIDAQLLALVDSVLVGVELTDDAEFPTEDAKGRAVLDAILLALQGELDVADAAATARLVEIRDEVIAVRDRLPAGGAASEATVASILAALGTGGDLWAILDDLLSAEIAEHGETQAALATNTAAVQEVRDEIIATRAILASQANRVLTATHTPTVPFVADDDYTSGWIDLRQTGHLILLLASTKDFAQVRIEWGDWDDELGTGIPNGGETILTNDPVAAGPLTYNVYLEILNIFTNGVAARIDVTNGPDDQDATLVGLLSTGKHPYMPLIGIDSPITTLSSALLTRNVQAVVTPRGDLLNLRGTIERALLTAVLGVHPTPAGDFPVTGKLDFIRHDFGVGRPGEADKLRDLGSGPAATKTQDAVNGGLVISSNGDRAFYGSEKALNYSDNTGHGGLAELTLHLTEDSDPIEGDAYVEFGLISPDLLSRICFRWDVDGIHTRVFKGTHQFDPVEVDLDVIETQAEWYGEQAAGGAVSQIVRTDAAGTRTPEAVDVDFGNLWQIAGEFLYYAEQLFLIKSPLGEILKANTHQFPNQHRFTSVTDANLLEFVDVNPGTTGNNIEVRCGSMHGFIFSNKTVQVGRQPNDDLEEVRLSGSDPANTGTHADVGAGGVFLGDAFDGTQWQSVMVVVNCSEAGQLTIEYSNDGFATLNHVTPPLLYGAADLGLGRLLIRPANLGEEYRIRFETDSGLTPAYLDVRTELSTTIVQPLTDALGFGTLVTSPALRLSQVFGREHVEVDAVGSTASGVIYTVPAGKRFVAQSCEWSIVNSDATGLGRARLRDGGAAGTYKSTCSAEEATSGLGGIATVANKTITYAEPMFFDTDVYLQHVTGTLDVDVKLVGYLEDA